VIWPGDNERVRPAVCDAPGCSRSALTTMSACETQCSLVKHIGKGASFGSARTCCESALAGFCKWIGLMDAALFIMHVLARHLAP